MPDRLTHSLAMVGLLRLNITIHGCETDYKYGVRTYDT